MEGAFSPRGNSARISSTSRSRSTAAPFAGPRHATRQGWSRSRSKGCSCERQHVPNSCEATQRLPASTQEPGDRFRCGAVPRIHVDQQETRRFGRLRLREVEVGGRVNARRELLSQLRQCRPNTGADLSRMRRAEGIDREHRDRLAVEARVARQTAAIIHTGRHVPQAEHAAIGGRP